MAPPFLYKASGGGTQVSQLVNNLMRNPQVRHTHKVQIRAVIVNAYRGAVATTILFNLDFAVIKSVTFVSYPDSDNGPPPSIRPTR